MKEQMSAEQKPVAIPTIEQLHRMPDAELLSYANANDDEAAWDEVSERGCERQFEGEDA